MTLAEVRSLDAGSHAGPGFAGERVPTYQEALEALRGSGATLVLDIKPGPTLDSERVVRLTERYGAAPDVIVGSRSVAEPSPGATRRLRSARPASNVKRDLLADQRVNADNYEDQAKDDRANSCFSLKHCEWLRSNVELSEDRYPAPPSNTPCVVPCRHHSPIGPEYGPRSKKNAAPTSTDITPGMVT
jgi:hypothetical protein